MVNIIVGESMESQQQASQSHILVERLHGIMKIKLNRPEKRNAMSLKMYKMLADAIMDANEDPGTRVMLIYGDNAFFFQR